MKNFIVAFMLLTTSSFAQVGINNPNPHASALLDLKSFDKGLLMPRTYPTLRTVIGTPANTLIMVDTVLNVITMYNSVTKKWYTINTFTSETDAAQKVLYTNAAQVNLDVNTVKVKNYPDNPFVPAGAIIMWSGTTVPPGWALCDGQPGTPDLRGRFIVGAGQNQTPNSRETNNLTYNIKDTGGINTYVLSSSESGLPAHNHTTSTTTNGNHNHLQLGQIVGNPDNFTAGDVSNGYNHSHLYSNYNIYSFTNPKTSDSGNHTHTVTVNNNNVQNAAQAHENRPAFYALAYIIKLP